MTNDGWIDVRDRMPRSGEEVLVACQIKLMSGKRYYICNAIHTEHKTVTADMYDDMDAEYDEETDNYYFPEGWWERIHNWDDYNYVAIEDFVTHWMPLPEPPKEDENHD